MIQLRAILVGEDYGNTLTAYCTDQYALTGGSGQRLARYAGLTLTELAARTRRTNIVVRPADWGNKLLVVAGAGRVHKMADELEVPVLLLGDKVARAMGLEYLQILKWVEGAHYKLARVPHPSGRSRYWNDPARAAEASAFLREVLGG